MPSERAAAIHAAVQVAGALQPLALALMSAATASELEVVCTGAAKMMGVDAPAGWEEYSVVAPLMQKMQAALDRSGSTVAELLARLPNLPGRGKVLTIVSSFGSAALAGRPAAPAGGDVGNLEAALRSASITKCFAEGRGGVRLLSEEGVVVMFTAECADAVASPAFGGCRRSELTSASSNLMVLF